MPRRFLTKRDIEDLAAAGTTRIELDAQTVVTDVARDRARELGVQLVPAAGTMPPPETGEHQARVRAAVIARLGITPADLDAVITRLLQGK